MVQNMRRYLKNGKLLGIGLLASLALGAIGLSPAHADFNLGAASNYAVLGACGASTTGSGSVIIGNVGIGSPGTLTLSGSTVLGSAQFQSPLVTSGMGQNYFVGPNGALVTGGVSGNVSLVGQAVKDATTLAQSVALGQPPPSNGITLIGGSQTITANPAGNTVVNLTSLSLTGGVLNISGSANSWLIINIASSLSLVGSVIDLVGGITADQVLFNVEGTGAGVNILGGTYAGTILAMNSSVFFSGGTLTGQILGGGANSQVTLSGTVTVNDAPPSPAAADVAPEPASLVLLCLGGISGAGVFGWKRWRRQRV